MKRPKVAKSWLERRIAKNQRRIQKLSEENFIIRQQIGELDKVPKRTPFVKPVESERVPEAVSPGGTI